MTLLESKSTLLLGEDITPMDSNNLWGYGHSIVAGVGATQPDRAYIGRLISESHSPISANFGVSGQTMGQTSSNMTGSATGNTDKGWVPGQSGLVVLDSEINSVINITSANDAQEKIGFQTGLKTALRILRSAQWIPEIHSSIVYTGAGWKAANVANTNGGTCRSTNVSGDKVTITVPSSESEIIIMLLGFPTATNGNFSITVNGSAFTPETSTCNNQTTTAEQWSPMSIRVPGLSGTSTIVLTNTSAGKDLYFDGYLTRNTNPPGIVVVKDAVPTNFAINGADTNRNVTNLRIFDGYIDTICKSTEFNDGTVQIADPNLYWNNNMFYDGVHPNNWGHRIYAYAVKKAAERLKMGLGLNRG